MTFTVEGDSKAVERLLEEIRDLEQEHLAEYRRVTLRSLELQEVSTERAEQISRLYVRALVAGGVLVIAFILLIGFIVVRYL